MLVPFSSSTSLIVRIFPCAGISLICSPSTVSTVTKARVVVIIFLYRLSPYIEIVEFICRLSIVVLDRIVDLSVCCSSICTSVRLWGVKGKIRPYTWANTFPKIAAMAIIPAEVRGHFADFASFIFPCSVRCI